MTRQVAAASHVGKVRSNNQDAGYAGKYLFIVADGMGGHAGGDVASAVTTRQVSQADQLYETPQEASLALTSVLLDANTQLTHTVSEHPELAGMGTTASALVQTSGHVVIAHIGDSRIYLYRGDELTQVTTDHTFVQRLVESGRITKEEAQTHPRRSVLMRVLGDVESEPEIETHVYQTQPGDRWLLCSDGLSGFVSKDEILATMQKRESVEGTVGRLLQQSLDHGAPDNVTAIIVDIDGATPDDVDPLWVGSATTPVVFGNESPERRLRRRQLLRPQAVRNSHFEPAAQDFLDELIEEDERRTKRKKKAWLVGIIIAAILLVVGIVVAWQWTQSRYYIGATEKTVAIFSGVPDIGPVRLSHVYENTEVSVNDLFFEDRENIETTIGVNTLEEAQQLVSGLRSNHGK